MVSQDDNIIERLRLTTECPAHWKLETLENKETNMLDKLIVKDEEIAGLQWRHIVLQLAISYECMIRPIPLTSDASQRLLDCNTWINNSDDNSFLKKYETAFKHLVQSFRAFVAVKKQVYPEARRCFNEIVNLEQMSKPDLAAVYGIKGNVFAEYGIGGTKEAFLWVRRALQLDDTEPEWHFLLGKLHARSRHYTLLREPCDEEVSSLEKAYQLYKAPHTAVYLAENYSERAKFWFHKQPLESGKRMWGPGIEVKVKNLNRRAMQLFNEAMEMNKDQCVHVMCRCARGFALLPDEFRRTSTALEIAEKALKKSHGNAMLRATLSLIHRCRHNIGGAIINCRESARAGAFGSHIRLMNLLQDFRNKVGTDEEKEVNIAAMIDKALAEFPLNIYRLQLYIYGANYFLFVKRNLFQSLPYFEKALELDSGFNLLKDRYVRWVKVYLNLFELMYNEIQCAISKESYVNENERLMLLRVRKKIIQAWPSVVGLPIEKDLVNRLKENRFASNRGRTRTRKNGKKDPKKRKTGKKDPKKRLKSAMSLSAHSKDTNNPNNRSSSDHRAFQSKSYFDDSQKTHKRPLSHDGRSQSRDNRKKAMVDVEKLKKSMSDLTIDDLKPDTATSKWTSGVQNVDLASTMSRMSLDVDEGGKKAKQNSYSKRSVSFERQSIPQKRTSAVKPLDDKNVLSFLPSFGKSTAPSNTVQYGSLTVANVEKLSNAKINESRESLDSDDTANSHASELSLQKSIATEQSVSSVSLTTKRSVSLDSSRCPVQSPTKKSDSWADLCENDPYVSAADDAPKVSNRPAVLSSSKLVNANRKGWNQEDLSKKFRDLSLEKKPYQGAGVNRNVTHRSVERGSSAMKTQFGQSSSRGTYERQSERSAYCDRRSPFGRHPSTEGRVLRPPGLRSSQRSDSDLSISSVDSDYVGSRWSKKSYRKNN